MPGADRWYVKVQRDIRLLLDEWWGVAIEIFIVIYSFVGLARVCDEFVVPAIEVWCCVMLMFHVHVLCVRWNIREDVAGGTFMAFSSACPEIVINCITTIKGASDAEATNLGVGAIIGSGMIAFSVIPVRIRCSLMITTGHMWNIQ